LVLNRRQNSFLTIGEKKMMLTEEGGSRGSRARSGQSSYLMASVPSKMGPFSESNEEMIVAYTQY
jgi:hypothetical protein